MGVGGWEWWDDKWGGIFDFGILRLGGQGDFLKRGGGVILIKI